MGRPHYRRNQRTTKGGHQSHQNARRLSSNWPMGLQQRHLPRHMGSCACTSPPVGPHRDANLPDPQITSESHRRMVRWWPTWHCEPKLRQRRPLRPNRTLLRPQRAITRTRTSLRLTHNTDVCIGIRQRRARRGPNRIELRHRPHKTQDPTRRRQHP